MNRRTDLRRSAIIAALVFAILGMSAPTMVAAANTETSPGDAQRLLRIIEEQQRRLDAQDAQIAEQRKALEKLRGEVEALQVQGGMPAPAKTAGETAAPPPTGQKSFKTVGAAHPEEWPGFYRVPGTNTRFKISGFAELDVIHDSDAILTPSAFVTSAIITRDATSAQGADGQTNFSIQATRLAVETRTPLETRPPPEGRTPHGADRRVTTFIAADFFNDFGSTTPELRLRQAYGEVTNFLHWGGDLLLGQDWSTFTNLYAVPNTLEFQAPNAMFGTRHPLARWTMPVGDSWKLKLAVEAPDLRQIQNASSTSRWPDGVVGLGWERAPYNLFGAFLARDLRASGGDGSTASGFGWGATVQGRINMPEAIKDDFVQFSLTYGEGIGGVFNDTPPDAVYDPANNDLKLIPTLGWLVGYQHQWSPKYYSLATYGWLKQDNEDIQAPTAFQKSQYGYLDFVWTPDPRWLLGAAVMYGSREDKDGESGSVIRTQITSRFNF